MVGYTIGMVIVAFIAAIITGAPQDLVTEKPMPYQYEYKVEDANTSVYYGAQESGNEAGRVEGSYYVWLPDRRLMKISYYVDGESGFVPKISFEENANPLGSGPN